LPFQDRYRFDISDNHGFVKLDELVLEFGDFLDPGHRDGFVLDDTFLRLDVRN
jgi:hypothetical protein